MRGSQSGLAVLKGLARIRPADDDRNQDGVRSLGLYGRTSLGGLDLLVSLASSCTNKKALLGCSTEGGSMSAIPAITNQVRVHIRWMIRRDMPEVLGIEHAGFEYPWSEDEFLRVLRQRNCIGMVADHGDQVVGFMIYELHKTRLQVLNYAVHPEFRRKGVGRQMIAKLVGKLSSHRRTKIALQVRESNLAAQLFFRSQDFRAIEVVREFYEDTGEDSYLLEYEVAESPSESSLQGPHWNRIARQVEG
jgi:[ribosomal protein S18]-alanine N-acetyltransferase